MVENKQVKGNVTFATIVGSTLKSGLVNGVSGFLSFVSFGYIKIEHLKRPIIAELKQNIFDYGVQITEETNADFLDKIQPASDLHIVPKAISAGYTVSSVMEKGIAQVGVEAALSASNAELGKIIQENATDAKLSTFATFIKINPKLGWELVDGTLDKALINRGFKNKHLRNMLKKCTMGVMSIYFVDAYTNTDLKSLALAGAAGKALNKCRGLAERNVEGKSESINLSGPVKSEVIAAQEDAKSNIENKFNTIKEQVRPGKVTFILVKAMIYGTLKGASFLLTTVTLGTVRCDGLITPIARSIRLDITGIFIHKVLDSTLGVATHLLTEEEQKNKILEFCKKHKITEFLADTLNIQLDNFIDFMSQPSDESFILSMIMPQIILKKMPMFISAYIRVNRDIATRQLGDLLSYLPDSAFSRFAKGSPRFQRVLMYFIKEKIVDPYYNNDGNYIAGAAITRLLTTELLPQLYGMGKEGTELVEEAIALNEIIDVEEEKFSYSEISKDIFAHAGIKLANSMLKVSSFGILSINGLERQYARRVQRDTLKFLSEGQVSTFAHAPDAIEKATLGIIDKYVELSGEKGIGQLSKNLTDIGMEGIEDFSAQASAISININSSWDRIDDHVVKSLAERNVTSSMLTYPMRKLVQYLVREYVVEDHVKEIDKYWVAAAIGDRVAIAIDFFKYSKRVCTFLSKTYGYAKVSLEQTVSTIGNIFYDTNLITINQNDIEARAEKSLTDKAAEKVVNGYKVDHDNLFELFNLRGEIDDLEIRLSKQNEILEEILPEFKKLEERCMEELNLQKENSSKMMPEAAFEVLENRYRHEKAQIELAYENLRKIEKKIETRKDYYQAIEPQIQELKGKLGSGEISQDIFDLKMQIIETEAQYKLGAINELRYSKRIERTQSYLELLESADDVYGNIFYENYLLPLGSKRGIISMHEEFDKAGKLVGMSAEGFSSSVNGLGDDEFDAQDEENSISITHEKQFTDILENDNTYTNIRFTKSQEREGFSGDFESVKLHPAFVKQHRNLSIGLGKAFVAPSRSDDITTVYDKLMSVVEDERVLYPISKFLNKTTAKKLSATSKIYTHRKFEGEEGNTWIKSNGVYLRIKESEPSYAFDIQKAPNGKIILSISTSWTVTQVSPSLSEYEQEIYETTNNDEFSSLYTSTTNLGIEAHTRGWSDLGGIFSDFISSSTPVTVESLGFMNVASVSMHAHARKKAAKIEE